MNIRAARETDVINIRRIHEAAIKEICAQDYPVEVISAWLGGIRDERYRQHILEYSYWVVEEQQTLKAFGCLNIGGGRLEALFVAPKFCGEGLAGRLLAHLERMATASGIQFMKVDASLTAKKFYAKYGYLEYEGSASLTLESGIVVFGIPMRKQLSSNDISE